MATKQSIANAKAEHNKKDGYLIQNVRQRKKNRGLKICSIEAF